MQILPLCRTLTSPPSLESLETALSQSPESPGTISWRVSSSRHPLRHTQGVFRVLGLRTSRLPRQVSTCSRASAVPSPRCLPANKPAPRPPVRIGTVSAAAPFASSFRSSQRKRLHSWRRPIGQRQPAACAGQRHATLLFRRSAGLQRLVRWPGIPDGAGHVAARWLCCDGDELFPRRGPHE